MIPIDLPFYLIVGSFIGTFLFIYRILIPYIYANLRLNRRLDQAGRTPNEQNFLQEQESLRKKRTDSTVDKKLAEFFKYTPTLSSKFHNFLYRSGFISYSKLFFLILFLFIMMSYLIGLIIFHPFSWNIILFSLSIGFLTFLTFLKAREHIWVRNVIHQFPNALDIINRSLKAGLPLKRGISLVAEEMANPIGGEFRYMEAQLQIGISAKQVFSEASERVIIEDFRLFTIALLLQQEMGGSLSDVLLKLYEVLSEREKIRIKIGILSTEAKTSSWIVSCLPFLVAGVLEYLNPDYMLFFFTASEGNLMMVIIIFLTIAGTMTIRRMTKFTQG